MRNQVEDVIESPSADRWSFRSHERGWLRIISVCYCWYLQNDWDELLSSAEFAYILQSAMIWEYLRSKLVLGWTPKSAVDLHARNECLVESVTESKPRLNETLSDAKCSYQVSEARQIAQRGKSYKAYLYKVGERLWINNTLCKDAYSKSPQSDKLSAKQFGPCFVKKLVGKNAVKV